MDGKGQYDGKREERRSVISRVISTIVILGLSVSGRVTFSNIHIALLGESGITFDLGPVNASLMACLHSSSMTRYLMRTQLIKLAKKRRRYASKTNHRRNGRNVDHDSMETWRRACSKASRSRFFSCSMRYWAYFDLGLCMPHSVFS